MEPLAARNPRVQQLRRLLRQRKTRAETGLFVLEGAGLVAEALAAGVTPVDVFVAVDADVDNDLLERVRRAGADVHHLEPSTIASVASTTTAQPVLATVPDVSIAVEAALTADATFIVVGAGIADPGNAGTIIRTAAAAGADAVIFCDGSVDIGNPKVVRATAGALFHVPVVRDVAADDLFATLEAQGIVSVGLIGAAAQTYDAIDYTGRTALVLGNEAHGVSEAVAAHLTTQVSIPMARNVESVNVAAAGAIVAFEVARQRRT